MGSTICTAGFPSAAIASSCFTARCDSIWYGFFIATLLFLGKRNCSQPIKGFERGSRYFLRSTGHSRLVGRRAQFQHLRIIAPQLLPELVGKPVTVGLQILFHARPLPEAKDGRLIQFDTMKTSLVGSQRVCHHKCVQIVVLGAGHRVPVAKAIHLFGVDGEHRQVVFDQAFHHCPVWHFDGNGYRTGISTSQLQQPVDTLPDAIAAVLDLFFTEHCAVVIDHTDVMMIRSPIDPRVIPECLGCRISSFCPTCRDASSIPVLALGCRRKLPTGRASRTPNRGAAPRQALGRRGASLALSVGRSSLLQWYRASAPEGTPRSRGTAPSRRSSWILSGRIAGASGGAGGFACPTNSQGNVETPRVGFAAQRVYSPRVSNSVEAAVTAAPSSTAVIARMRILSLSGKVSVLAPDGTSKA